MIINIDYYEKNFIETINQFLKHEIDCDEFCDKFTDLWIMYRDEQLKIQETLKKTWDRPYDQELIAAKLEGKITSEEFSQKYLALWEMEEPKDFENMINSIHSLCSSYSNQPVYEWQVDENVLFSEVASLLQIYIDN